MAIKTKKTQVTKTGAKKLATKKTAAKRGSGAPEVGAFGTEEVLGYYRDMLLIRRFEERPARCTAWA